MLLHIQVKIDYVRRYAKIIFLSHLIKQSDRNRANMQITKTATFKIVQHTKATWQLLYLGSMPLAGSMKQPQQQQQEPQ